VNLQNRWLRMKRKFVFSFLLAAILVPSAFAAPSLKVTAPPAQISLSERSTLTLQLEWPAAEDPYEINSLEPKTENLELVDQNQSQETGAVVRQTITYTFRAIKKGSALIYPFEISYRKSETDPWSPILIPEQKIRVTSSFPLKSIFIGIIILLGVTALGYGIFITQKILAKKKAASEMPPPDPRQRIYANAEEAIATFASPDAKIKLTHWSNQLRAVVATYYDATAKGNSNTGLLLHLKSKGLPTGEWNEVSQLLEQLTEMQFSRQDIPSYDLDRLQKTLLQYIKGKIIIENSNS